MFFSLTKSSLLLAFEDRTKILLFTIRLPKLSDWIVLFLIESFLSYSRPFLVIETMHSLPVIAPVCLSIVLREAAAYLTLCRS